MTSSATSALTHVYQRDVRMQESDSLTKILRKIAPGSAVLDVGTGSGALGRYLHQQGGFVVDGLTYNTEEAQLAKAYYRTLSVIDLEQQSVLKHIAADQYDVIVCADVLEHLRNAPVVLSELAALLRPGGVVVVSLPNVTHLGVMLGLMAGRFVRTREGLLDSTHVHFMDRVALQTLVHEAGMVVAEEDIVERNLVDTEFAKLDIQVLPMAVRAYVQSLPDSQVYQFVWTLRPRPDSGGENTPPPASLPAVPTIDQMPRFRAQVFLDRGQGFSEEDCVDAFGLQTDTGIQTLQFPIERGDLVRTVRLDFTDRPGQVEFVHFTALDDEGNLKWQWSGDWAANLIYHQTDWTGVRGWRGGRIVRAMGDDPWVQIPVSLGQWEGVQRLELKMAGPQPVGSTDWPGLDANQLKLDVQSLLLAADILTTQASDRTVELQAQLLSARSLADFRQTDIDVLRGENTDLQRQLDCIRMSFSWRLTAGLRWLRRQLK